MDLNSFRFNSHFLHSAYPICYTGGMQKTLDDIIIITDLAIQEDIGTGDITSELTIHPEQESSGQIIAKEDGVISGLFVVEYMLKHHTSISYTIYKQDGESVTKGDTVLSINGRTIEILSYERIMLNFLQHLSGIATKTHRFVEMVEACGCEILDTRKTLPGMRKLEKKAVIDGGGCNHRMGLSDAILIKENHIQAAGSISAAVKKIKSSNKYPILQKQDNFFILVETETIDEVEEACETGVDGILLDNMDESLLTLSINTIRQMAPNIFIEVSGNVSLDTIANIAQHKPDRISVGSITHSAPALDFSLLINKDN